MTKQPTPELWTELGGPAPGEFCSDTSAEQIRAFMKQIDAFYYSRSDAPIEVRKYVRRVGDSYEMGRGARWHIVNTETNRQVARGGFASARAAMVDAERRFPPNGATVRFVDRETEIRRERRDAVARALSLVPMQSRRELGKLLSNGAVLHEFAARLYQKPKTIRGDGGRQ